MVKKVARGMRPTNEGNRLNRSSQRGWCNRKQQQAQQNTHGQLWGEDGLADADTRQHPVSSWHLVVIEAH